MNNEHQEFKKPTKMYGRTIPVGWTPHIVHQTKALYDAIIESEIAPELVSWSVWTDASIKVVNIAYIKTVSDGYRVYDLVADPNAIRLDSVDDNYAYCPTKDKVLETLRNLPRLLPDKLKERNEKAVAAIRRIAKETKAEAKFNGNSFDITYASHLVNVFISPSEYWKCFDEMDVDLLVLEASRFASRIDQEQEHRKQDRADTARRRQVRNDIIKPTFSETTHHVLVFLNWEGRSYSGPWAEDANICLDVMVEFARGPIKWGYYDVGVVFIAPAEKEMRFYVRSGSCSQERLEIPENITQEEIESTKYLATSRSGVLKQMIDDGVT